MLKPTAINVFSVNEAKEVSPIMMTDVPDLPHPHSMALKANLSADGQDLAIELVHQKGTGPTRRRASFRFDAMRGDMVVGPAKGNASGDHPPFNPMARRFMGLQGGGSLTAMTSADAPDGFPILRAGPAFVVTTLNQFYGKPLAAPFFVTDTTSSYFVDCKPASTTVYKTIDAPAAAAPGMTAKSTLSAVALQTSLTLASTAAAAKPWIRAEARSANYASNALTQSWAEAATPSAAEKMGLSKALGPQLSLGLQPVSATTVSTTFTPFFHPFVETFTVAIHKHGLDRLFSLDIQGSNLKGANPFNERYNPDPNQVTNSLLVEAVDFGVGTPFGVHNYELFLHLPLMLQALHVQNNRADLGLPWGARVCDLLGVETDPAEAWNFLPFREETDTPSFGELLDALASGPDDSRRQQALAQIESSQLFPFQPFRIARLRPDAMKKYAFLQVFNARFALADQHFARYTPEDVSFSLLEYLVLDAGLGRTLEVLPPAQPVPAKSYAELRPHLDEAGDAVLTVETKLGALAALGAPVAPGSGQSVNLRLAASRYFCVPPNKKLLELWERIDDRLHKIRNGLTIDGVRRPLGLFGPKIDPALMVLAAAAGGDLNIAANEAGGKERPNYRFPVLLRMAKERAERLIAINNSLLQTLKEANVEHLQAMRARHEGEMMMFIGEARQLQIEEAEQALVALAAQRAAIMVRWRHFRQQLGFDDLAEPATDTTTGIVIESGQRESSRAFKLVDGAAIQVNLATPADPTGTIQLSPNIKLQSGKILEQEREEVLLSFGAAAAQTVASHLHAVAGLIKALPNFEAAAKPMGAGAGVNIGGVNLGGAIEAGAQEVGTVGTVFGFLASNAGKQASFLWRERDFALQLRSAAAEALHVDQQIIGATKAQASRKKDKEINEQQVLRNAAVLDYLTSKFSSEDFHMTMAGELTSLQKQAWTAALDKLNEARAAFAFDFSALDVPPMPTHLWDMAPKGLLSGEALVLACQQLESAYMAHDQRRLELTRNFSLKQVNPFALMRLRETGQCSFELSKALYDMDNPGHSDRRVLDVRLSIPAVTGPYTPVSATLQLTESKSMAKDGIETTFTLPQHASVIVTSSGREDGGQFQPDRPNDRYGPLEGAGAHATFNLDLPTQLRSFSYRTIPDVIITVRYRADHGGNLDDAAAKAAASAVTAAMDASKPETARTGAFHLASARHDFPDDWRRWEMTPDQPLKLIFTRNQLPFAFQGLAKLKPDGAVVLWAAKGAPLTDNDIAAATKVTMSPRPTDPDTWDVTVPAPPVGGAPMEEAYVFLNYTVGV